MNAAVGFGGNIIIKKSYNVFALLVRNLKYGGISYFILQKFGSILQKIRCDYRKF